MNTSMAIKVVVPGLHGGRHIHLQQALANRVRLLHEAKVHSANAILGQCERSLEWCVGQQVRARPLCSVRRLEFSRHLPREQKRKRRLIVAGARTDVLLQALSDAAGPAHVDGSIAFRQPVNAALGHSADGRQRGDGDRLHRHQSLKRRRQLLDHGGKFSVDHEASVSGSVH
jgi:hypothetical protein